MSSPTDRGEQPHLISLVLQSKKALEQGKEFCFRADATSTSSAKEATDLLALNAKIQWISNAVIEQLKAWIIRIFAAFVANAYVASRHSSKAHRRAARQAREADPGAPSLLTPMHESSHAPRPGIRLVLEILIRLMRSWSHWRLMLCHRAFTGTSLAPLYSSTPPPSPSLRDPIMSQNLITALLLPSAAAMVML
jgi:hypothetical protein